MQLLKQPTFMQTIFNAQDIYFMPLLKKGQEERRKCAGYKINNDTLINFWEMPGDKLKCYPVCEEYFLINEYPQIYKNEEQSERKRFDKSFSFLFGEGDRTINCLPEIFQNFQLDDFRVELNLWQEMALSNDQSAYDRGYAREDLIDFLKELLKLIEAFHMIKEMAFQQRKNETGRQLSKQTRKLLAGFNIPVLLNKEELTRPSLVIGRFCNTFSKDYVNMEILDLLDAVLTYDGPKEIYKTSLVLFYQHLHFLTGLAYNLTGSNPGLDQNGCPAN